MNGSFWTWFGVASAIALGILLLFIPASPPEAAAPAGSTAESAYFEPVLPPVQASGPGSAPCPPCGYVLQPVVPCPPPSPTVAALRSACGRPVSPCPPCVQVASGIRPAINRNLPPCIDECSFIQLHTTIPQPISSCLRFEWLATQGRFLDPTAADPIYYAPATGLPGGEDVFIVLAVTDPAGVVYTDRVRLHVRNVR